METGPGRYRIAEEICFSPATEDGCIILNVAQDSVLSLNSTGAWIFATLAASKKGMTRAELIEAVSNEFDDVEPRRIELGIDSLLTQLTEKRVLSTEVLGLKTYAERVRTRLVQDVTTCFRKLVSCLLWVKAHTAAAVLMLTIADVLLKFGGFGTLCAMVKRWKLRRNPGNESEIVAKGCAVVEQACIWHPKQKLCLQRSAVVTCLLRSVGVPAEMVIGVHKMPFYGHSWVEVNGCVVNDHKNVQTFFQVLSRC